MYPDFPVTTVRLERRLLVCLCLFRLFRLFSACCRVRTRVVFWARFLHRDISWRVGSFICLHTATVGVLGQFRAYHIEFLSTGHYKPNQFIRPKRIFTIPVLWVQKYATKLSSWAKLAMMHVANCSIAIRTKIINCIDEASDDFFCNYLKL